MRRWVLLAVASCLLLPLLTPADADDNHSHHLTPEPSSPNDPPIKITINPEARVSVSLGGTLPPPAECGKSAEIPVKIINQGFVTAPVVATLVDAASNDVLIEFYRAPLLGVPEERRVLRVTVTKPGLVDLTVSFRARNDTPDLRGRDRIHFLLTCTQSKT